MRIATVRTSQGTQAIREDGTALGFASVGELLREPDWRELAAADGEEIEYDGFAPVIPHPAKIICVGLNYREHILEMGHPIPEHPTLFVKFADALTGPFDDVQLIDGEPDYEGELAVIAGHDGDIAGYSVINDFSMRDLQYRTLQWHQGKSQYASSGFGPWLSTEEPGQLRTWVNGDLRQDAPTRDLVFSPRDLVDYIRTLYPLNPGDVICTGTPAGVGHPEKRYLKDGDVVRIEIENVGALENTFRGNV